MSGDVVLQTNQDVVSTPDDMVRSVESATKNGQKRFCCFSRMPGGKSSLSRCRLGKFGASNRVEKRARILAAMRLVGRGYTETPTVSTPTV
jgi:hypothetical protein